MTDDAIETLCLSYERLQRSLKHLEREMCGYRKLMSDLRQSNSWDEYHRVRMDADILAQSIAFTQKQIERYEAKLADQFADHRPFTGSAGSDAYCY